MPVELAEENGYAFEIWDLIFDQVKVSPAGKVYSIDVGGISNMLRNIGLEDFEVEDMLKKIRVIFKEKYRI